MQTINLHNQLGRSKLSLGVIIEKDSRLIRQIAIYHIFYPYRKQMATPTNRTEYADKTLAMNAMIDRQLKIKISTIDAESSIYRRDLAREEKQLRQELNNTRRMSVNCAPSSNLRVHRRSSSPIRCRIDGSSGENLPTDTSSSSLQRLELPSQGSLRRRSLPDMEKLYLPAISGSRSLTAAKPTDTMKKESIKARGRAGRRSSENVAVFSQQNTLSLSPRHSISSLVSSLSSSSSRLQTVNDSEETFDKVRQFLQKLEASKLRSDSEKSNDSEETQSNDENQ